MLGLDTEGVEEAVQAWILAEFPALKAGGVAEVDRADSSTAASRRVTGG